MRPPDRRNIAPAKPPQVVLIGGSSHAGKTTAAAAVAQWLGGEALSTDSLARHPGRPFARTVPAHVAEHYLSLTPSELLASVVAHYRSLAPSITEIVRAQAGRPGSAPLVFEGSALLPETTASLHGSQGVVAVYLTAKAALFRDRIHRQSGFETADARRRAMIDAFVGRTLAFDAAMMDEVRRLRLASLVVEDGWSAEALTQACLETARQPGASGG